MAYVSRTVNPLHFENLEPHRFEDLVRQLAYDFRLWRKLEATGRSGSDHGFDARGLEIVGTVVEQEAAENQDGEICDVTSDRLWLIQCKRERSIGPRKLVAYINDIPAEERSKLYGLLLAAPCDFSKKSRDDFEAKCREFGATECFVWGKGELEDMLFQPKNDHLLFAYFGFSLNIRRRSLRVEIRSRLAIKRKAHKVLSGHRGNAVLLRDPGADQYPYSEGIADFDAYPLWRMWQFEGFTHAGLEFKTRRSFAYIGDDQKQWDAAFAHNELTAIFPNPWLDDRETETTKRQAIAELWETLPERNKAWLEVVGTVPYDAVIDIDETGDDFAETPHIYVPFDQYDKRPFTVNRANLRNLGRTDEEHVDIYLSSDADRIAYFPEEFRLTPVQMAKVMLTERER